jgi:hypothetical protein
VHITTIFVYSKYFYLRFLVIAILKLLKSKTTDY